MDLNEDKKELTLEESFSKLDAIIKKMEGTELTLEERFVLYKEGMELIKDCSDRIDTVEKKMKLVDENFQLREEDQYDRFSQ